MRFAIVCGGMESDVGASWAVSAASEPRSFAGARFGSAMSAGSALRARDGGRDRRSAVPWHPLAVLGLGAIRIPIAADGGGSAGGQLQNGYVVKQFRKRPAGLLVRSNSRSIKARVCSYSTPTAIWRSSLRGQFCVIAQHRKPAHVVARQAAPGHSWPQRPLSSGDEKGSEALESRLRVRIGIVVCSRLRPVARCMRWARRSTASAGGGGGVSGVTVLCVVASSPAPSSGRIKATPDCQNWR